MEHFLLLQKMRSDKSRSITLALLIVLINVFYLIECKKSGGSSKSSSSRSSSGTGGSSRRENSSSRSGSNGGRSSSSGGSNSNKRSGMSNGHEYKRDVIVFI